MITVLMSTYNGEKYIREQINSILSQENVEVELLIRDDGSTDNTINILKELEKTNDNMEWYTGYNLGCGKSFYQLVLDAPKSEYYAFADQDDVWNHDKLAVAILKLSNYASHAPSLYCSTAKPVDENLNDIPHTKPQHINLTLGIALTQSIAPGCSYVFNNLLLEKFKRLGMENVDIHDWALLRVVTAVDGFVYFDTESHFLYRQHENNVIGYRKSFIQHWVGRVKRFKIKDYRRIRSKMARHIKNAYYEDMNTYNKSIIDTFVNYNLSFKNRIDLFKFKDIHMRKKTDNIVFRLLVLFGLV